ncbi:hypothetical protein ABZ136_36680, partial [Streptomyces microflavus]
MCAQPSRGKRRVRCPRSDVVRRGPAARTAPTTASARRAEAGPAVRETFFRPDAAGEDERIDFGALAYDDITMARL